MSLKQAFEILQIEQTKDKRAIKRAYAQQVKEYHPEEHPDEWQRVHDAYECAMEYAGRVQEMSMPSSYKMSSGMEYNKSESVGNRQPLSWEMPSDMEDVLKQRMQSESSENESDDEIENIENLVQQGKRKIKSEEENVLVEALNALSELGEHKKLSVKQWEQFWEMPQVQAVRTNAAFLYCLGEQLNTVKIGSASYKLLKKFLGEIYLEMTESTFYDGEQKDDLGAWESASKALEQAVWWKFVRTVKKAMCSREFRYGWCIAFIALSVLIRFNGPLFKIGDHLNKYRNNKEILLEIEREGNTNAVRFGDKHVLLSRDDSQGWRMRYMFPSSKLLTNWGIESEGETVACFEIGNTNNIEKQVNVYLSLEDFGLSEGAYEVWQFHNGAFQKMKVHTGASAGDSIETSYPYEKDGYLYLRVDVFSLEDLPQEVVSQHPVIILKTDAYE